MIDLILLSFPVFYGLFLSRVLAIFLCRYEHEVTLFTDTSFPFGANAEDNTTYHDAELLEEIKRENHADKIKRAKSLLHEYFDSSADSIADHLKMPRMSVRSLCKRSKRPKGSKNNDYDFRIVNQ